MPRNHSHAPKGTRILMSPSAAAMTSFATLGVSAKLVKTLAAADIAEPFPIQEATLPDTLAQRDVLGRGKTGSGKTLAFSIPMVQLLEGVARRPGKPSGLILAPTRELATQIAATLTPLAEVCGLRVTTAFGGAPVNRQIRAIGAGTDILVACPGRLEDLMRQRVVALDSVRITVLDEADHMADLGFLVPVTRILAATADTGQRLLFSATLDNGVDTLVERFLHNPVAHSIREADTPVPVMTHQVFEVPGAEAKRELIRVLAAGHGRRILFMRTKHHAARLAKQLTNAGIAATTLHGNLSQAARDRNLSAFSTGAARVLVATDIAARGVHVDDVELVVHVDPPAEHKAYLHRSGRTARAGSAGDVVTLTLPEQRKDVSTLLRKAGIDAQPQRVAPRSDAVVALVGAREGASSAGSSGPAAAVPTEPAAGDGQATSLAHLAEPGLEQRKLPRKRRRRGDTDKRAHRGPAESAQKQGQGPRRKAADTESRSVEQPRGGHGSHGVEHTRTAAGSTPPAAGAPRDSHSSSGAARSGAAAKGQRSRPRRATRSAG